MGVTNHLENYLQQALWSEDEPDLNDELKPMGRFPEQTSHNHLNPLQKGKGAVN